MPNYFQPEIETASPEEIRKIQNEKIDISFSEEDEEEEEETIQIFTVSDVDFGIVERPRYKVQVDNVINKITLKTSEGSVLKEIIPSAFSDML